MQYACTVLYCHLWSAQFYNIFPHYPINSMIFERKKLMSIKSVFIFFPTFIWNVSLSRRNWSRYDQDMIMKSTCHSFQIKMKVEFSVQIFKKCSNTNFMKICWVGAKVFHVVGQTDMMKLIVDFHNVAKVPKNEPVYLQNVSMKQKWQI